MTRFGSVLQKHFAQWGRYLLEFSADHANLNPFARVICFGARTPARGRLECAGGAGIPPLPTPASIGHHVPSSQLAIKRFRTRRDAERVLAEIMRDGGHEADYRIEQDADGSCLITILEGDRIAGALGA